MSSWPVLRSRGALLATAYNRRVRKTQHCVCSSKTYYRGKDGVAVLFPVLYLPQPGTSVLLLGMPAPSLGTPGPAVRVLSPHCLPLNKGQRCFKFFGFRPHSTVDVLTTLAVDTVTGTMASPSYPVTSPVLLFHVVMVQWHVPSPCEHCT